MTCHECGGKGKVRSGLMVVDRSKVQGQLLGRDLPEDPVVMVHPEVMKEVMAKAGPMKDVTRACSLSLALRNVEVIEDENVPLWVSCKDCGGTGIGAKVGNVTSLL